MDNLELQIEDLEESMVALDINMEIRTFKSLF